MAKHFGHWRRVTSLGPSICGSKPDAVAQLLKDVQMNIEYFLDLELLLVASAFCRPSVRGARL